MRAALKEIAVACGFPLYCEYYQAQSSRLFPTILESRAASGLSTACMRLNLATHCKMPLLETACEVNALACTLLTSLSPMLHDLAMQCFARGSQLAVQTFQRQSPCTIMSLDLSYVSVMPAEHTPLDVCQTLGELLSLTNVDINGLEKHSFEGTRTRDIMRCYAVLRDTVLTESPGSVLKASDPLVRCCITECLG